MKRIIIDASMAAAWTLEDERSAAGDEILSEIRNFLRLTTTLFWHEYRNILVVNEKRRRVVKTEIPELLREMRTLNMWECPFNNDEIVISLAFQYELSAYDAAYLALAIQENALLATNDKKLAHAAWMEGIELRTVLNREDFAV